MTLPALIQKPRRYRPHGDSELRDRLLAALDSLPEPERMGLALMFCIDALAALEENSIGPAQRRFAAAHIDAVRDLVPADIVELVKNAKKRSS